MSARLSSLWAWRHKTGFQAAPASRAWVWTLPRDSDRSATTSTSARTKMAAVSRILCVSTPMDLSTAVPALLVNFRIFYAFQRGKLHMCKIHLLAKTFQFLQFFAAKNWENSTSTVRNLPEVACVNKFLRFSYKLVKTGEISKFPLKYENSFSLQS